MLEQKEADMLRGIIKVVIAGWVLKKLGNQFRRHQASIR
jgi:hypothetical protein